MTTPAPCCIFSSPSTAHRSLPRPRRGFTLIELLTVIAIIGILAALLFPSIGAANRTAKKSKTRVQFNQWAAAMEQFKQEYGYYPQIDSGGAANKVNSARFAGALTGRRLDGSVFASNTDVDLAGNKKMISFYTIGENELSGDRTRPDTLKLVDAFENTDIAVFYDKDGDARITTTDGAAVPVTSVGGATFTPDAADLNLAPTAGVRAGVIFYSAGFGKTAADLVFSWK